MAREDGERQAGKTEGGGGDGKRERESESESERNHVVQSGLAAHFDMKFACLPR